MEWMMWKAIAPSSQHLMPPTLRIRRSEDGDFTVEDKFPAYAWAAPSLNRDCAPANARAALLNGLKIVPVASLAPAHVLKLRPFLALEFALRI